VPGFSISYSTLKNIVYLSDCSMISATSPLRSLSRDLAGWLMISKNDSRPTPPFPISRLKSLIPITIFESSHSYATFSGVVRETNGLRPALGRTDSRAAATSLSMVFEIEAVSLMEE